MKKLGFCFLIYDVINFEELWNEWFKNIDTDKYSIYVHYKTNKPLKFFDKYKLQNCIPTAYRQVSIVHAHNLLFKQAFDDGCYKIISLSGACIPWKSFDHVYDFLTNDDFAHFNMTVNQRGVVPRCEPAFQHVDKKHIHKTSNWFILNRPIAEKIVSNPKEYIDKVWGSVQFSEEHYFITEVFRHNLQSQVITTPNLPSGATTFTNWHDMRSYPFVNDRYLKNYSKIVIEEVEYLLKEPCLFGRKFNPGCYIENLNISLSEFLKKRICSTSLDKQLASFNNKFNNFESKINVFETKLNEILTILTNNK